MESRVDPERLRETLDGLDAAMGTLGEAHDVCYALGREEEMHDCSMAIGIIEEVGAVVESAAGSAETSGPEDPNNADARTDPATVHATKKKEEADKDG